MDRYTVCQLSTVQQNTVKSNFLCTIYNVQCYNDFFNFILDQLHSGVWSRNTHYNTHFMELVHCWLCEVFWVVIQLILLSSPAIYSMMSQRQITGRPDSDFSPGSNVVPITVQPTQNPPRQNPCCQNNWHSSGPAPQTDRQTGGKTVVPLHHGCSVLLVINAGSTGW